MAKALDVATGSLRKLEPLFSRGVCARGERYARGGQVEIASATDGALSARVQGEQLYRVVLRASGTSLDVECTCPHFADSDALCKHIWATILVASNEGHLAKWGELRGIATGGDGPGDSVAAPKSPGLRLAYSAPARPVAPEAPAIARGREAPGARPSASGPPNWRRVLEGDAVRREAQGAGATRKPELRYVIDLNRARVSGRLTVCAMERTKVGPAPWRKARVRHPLSAVAAPEDVALLTMLESASWTRHPVLLRLDALRVRAAGRAGGRNRRAPVRVGEGAPGDHDAPPLRWEARHSLALEGVPRDDGDGLSIRAWLQRGGERLPATDPVLVVFGLALWFDRVAPIDEHGSGVACLFAERSGEPAHVPACEVMDLLEALSLESGRRRSRCPRSTRSPR